MAVATDLQYNADGREVSLRLDIFFNGASNPPLTIDKHNYLIDADWLEEGAADTTNPFGYVSSNELSFRLLNTDKIFTPTNASGPYYGKILKGVKIELFICIEGFDWDLIGTYYVTSWNTELTGTYADITANDEWHSIFNMSSPNVPVELDTTYKAYYEKIFSAMTRDVIVDTSLTRKLSIAYTEGAPVDFLQELCKGSLSYCSCTKEGKPTIERLVGPRPLRASVLDSSQVKSISAAQSITGAYSGVELTYALPQISLVKQLAKSEGLMLEAGTNAITDLTLDGPVRHIACIGIEGAALVTDYTSSPWLISLNINSEEDAVCTISVQGTSVELASFLISDVGSNLLQLNSAFIQDRLYAISYKELLTNFVNNDIPVLTVEMRGNPTFRIGDRLKIISYHYGVEFDGILHSAQYNYNGALSCTAMLLNYDVFKEVL